MRGNVVQGELFVGPSLNLSLQWYLRIKNMYMEEGKSPFRPP